MWGHLSYGYIRYKLVPVVKGKLSCNYYDQKFLIMSKKHDNHGFNKCQACQYNHNFMLMDRVIIFIFYEKYFCEFESRSGGWGTLCDKVCQWLATGLCFVKKRIHVRFRVLAWFGFMVFSATFNNISFISWRLVFLMEENGGPGEKHWHTLSHNILFRRSSKCQWSHDLTRRGLEQNDISHLRRAHSKLHLH
jgi:hypothetical protein